MGINIDLHVVGWTDLRTALVENGAEDGELLDNILLECGIRSGPNYYILNNEYYENYNPYYNLASLLDSAFPELRDRERERPGFPYWHGSFDCILEMRESSGKNAVDMYDVAARLGFEIWEDS
jgi:hypothetical protein